MSYDDPYSRSRRPTGHVPGPVGEEKAPEPRAEPLEVKSASIEPLLERIDDHIDRIDLPGIPQSFRESDHDLHWIVQRWSNQSLPASGTLTLMDLENEHGFVSSMRIVMDSPQPDVTVRTEGQDLREKIDDLNTWGLVAPSPSHWWVGAYNTVDDVYSLMWTPAVPWRYYNRLKMWVDNPVDVAVEVSAMVSRWRYPRRGN